MNASRLLWLAVVLGLGLVLGDRPAAASTAPAKDARSGELDAGPLSLQRPTGCTTTPRGLRRDVATSPTDLPAPGRDDTPGAPPPAADPLPRPAVVDAGATPAPDQRGDSTGPRSSGCRVPPRRA